MKWLFIINPIEKLNPDTDTTYPILKESFNRNINTFITTTNNLFFNNNLKVFAQKIEFDDNYHVSEKELFFVDDFDLIFMRKDPPYDLEYHYSLCMLSIASRPVVNSPRALRERLQSTGAAGRRRP